MTEKSSRQAQLPDPDTKDIQEALSVFNSVILRELLLGRHIRKPELSEIQVRELQRMMDIYISLISIGKASYRQRYEARQWDIKIAPKTREKIHKERGGVCAACGNTIPFGPNAFHFHHTDYTRYKDRSTIQILCHRCHNRVALVTAFALALLSEDIGLLSPVIKHGTQGDPSGPTQLEMF